MTAKQLRVDVVSGTHQDQNRTVKVSQCTLVKGSTLRGAFLKSARGRVPAAAAPTPAASAETPEAAAASPAETEAKATAFALSLFGDCGDED